MTPRARAHGLRRDRAGARVAVAVDRSGAGRPPGRGSPARRRRPSGRAAAARRVAQRAAAMPKARRRHPRTPRARTTGVARRAARTRHRARPRRPRRRCGRGVAARGRAEAGTAARLARARRPLLRDRRPRRRRRRLRRSTSRHSARDPQLLQAAAALAGQPHPRSRSAAARAPAAARPPTSPRIRMLAEVAGAPGPHRGRRDPARALPRARAGLRRRAPQLRDGAAPREQARPRRWREIDALLARDPRNPGYRNLQGRRPVPHRRVRRRRSRSTTACSREYPRHAQGVDELRPRAEDRRPPGATRIDAYRRSLDARRRASARRGGAWPTSRPSASADDDIAAHARAARARRPRPTRTASTSISRSARRWRTRASTRSPSTTTRSGNALRRADARLRRRRDHRARARARRRCSRASSSPSAPARAAPAPDPIFIVGLPRVGLDADRADPVQPLAGRRHAWSCRTSSRSRASSAAAATRAEAPRYPRRAGDARRRRAARARRAVPRAHAHPAQDRPPFFIDKMPNNFAHVGLIHLILPNAKIIDARRHPLGCCFSRLQAALRARPELHLRPRRHRPLLPRLRRADGALRRGAAGARARVIYEAHGRRHRGRGAPRCWTTAACRSRRRACASTRTSAPCAPPAPSRCASRSTATASTSGGTTSPGSARSKAALGPVLDGVSRRAAVLIPWRKATIRHSTGRESGCDLEHDARNRVATHAAVAQAAVGRPADRCSQRAVRAAHCWRRRRRRAGATTQTPALDEVVVTAQKRDGEPAERADQHPGARHRAARRAAASTTSTTTSKFLPSVVGTRRGGPGLRAASTCAASPAATTATTPARCPASACISTSSRSPRSRARSTSTCTTSRASKRSPARRARCTARARRRAPSASSPTSRIRRASRPATTLEGNTRRARRHRLRRRRLRQRAARRAAPPSAWSAGTSTTPATSTTCPARAPSRPSRHHRSTTSLGRGQLQRRRHLRRARRR